MRSTKVIPAPDGEVFVLHVSISARGDFAVDVLQDAGVTLFSQNKEAFLALALIHYSNL